ncbi:zinc-binding dehydrogenase [Patulibacter brassicae]|uniref:Zinc-binding dehydrogenase n=1 Tax=Patulibacter brassicae TaxID=1705717 RepID=A0ABU4VKF3_9ACTN|nr:zinc-binding dehydrogenase [Patulibacter brassicae]MDX8152346.1 zinc-binding dehydrogenase [Patulibacter brassicae]
MSTSVPSSGRVVRSTITADGELRVAIAEEAVPVPGDGEVLVAVSASPVNPSDLGVLLGPADPSSVRLERDGRELRAALDPRVLPHVRERLGLALRLGNEGTGTVVACGPGAEELQGRRVAALAGGMWADFRVVRAADVAILPDEVRDEDAAAMHVNPLTALAMVETMRAEGHTALVHTAAASSLGQMLVRICLADGVELVNVVRSPAQATLLRDLGATHVVDSSADGFDAALTAAVAETGATLAFDAVGGGRLASRILGAMERAARDRLDQPWSPYGTDVPKQVYVYGSLDRSPTEIHRAIGMTWSVGGFLLMRALQRLGPAAAGAMRARVLAELGTTFRTEYDTSIPLGALLDPEQLAASARTGTGGKRLVAPGLDRAG